MFLFSSLRIKTIIAGQSVKYQDLSEVSYIQQRAVELKSRIQQLYLIW